MKRLTNRGSIAVFLAFALGAGSVSAATPSPAMSTMESVTLESVLAAHAMPVSGNTSGDNVTGAANLLWVVGASLVGFSLVMRRVSA